MEGKEVIEKILPNKSAYEKTMYLLYNYKDLKSGEEINTESREVLKVLDKAIDCIKEDKYIDIIKLTIQGVKTDKIAEMIPLERNTVYKHKRRLIKRISVILYGDKAL